jgi:pyruvate formate lyase activating enzyme
MSRIKCRVCPHRCALEEGHNGLCRARSNLGGVIICDNYGLVTSLALDPIEKKPLRRFYPGSMILSVGSYGCNFHCPFCQNYEISMADGKGADCVFISPESLVAKALELVPEGNIGLAFTYNEPLIGYEYVRDCATAAKEIALKTVLVTNGYINAEPLLELLPFIDAMNIDLKCFSEDFYRRIGGGLEDVKRTIALAARECHVEVTTLIIPKENDTADEIRSLSRWLGSIDSAIPLHISRFFPRYRMTDRHATDPDTIYMLADVARESLRFVYEGNC